jgi:nucleotide-binding universal stress UspA family protein
MQKDSAQSQPANSNINEWPTGRYVVGIDGSESSNNALRHALRLAALTGAQVEAVTTWQYPVSYEPVWTPTEWSPEGDAQKILADAIQSVVGAEIPARLTPVVRRGDTAGALIEESEDADLLVVGSRGHGGFAGLLLGSVSAACAEHAPCPVLVVHGARAVLPNPAERDALDL